MLVKSDVVIMKSRDFLIIIFFLLLWANMVATQMPFGVQLTRESSLLLRLHYDPLLIKIILAYSDL